MISLNHIVRIVYDPCCGTGGMLTIAKGRILEINPQAEVHLFGQEVNAETFGVCKSDLDMKSADGRDAENIKYGSTLSNDQLSCMDYDFLGLIPFAPALPPFHRPAISRQDRKFSLYPGENPV